MRHLTLLIGIFIAQTCLSQNHNFDTLPRFKYQNVVSFQAYSAPSVISINYSRNFWSGLGYRNYEEISIGGGFGRRYFRNHAKQYEYIPVASFDIKLQHNARFNLKHLFYFSVAIGYAPMIALKKSDLVTFDDFINSGYALLGFSGNIRTFAIGFYLGASVTETKQDLYSSVHTYAEWLPQIRLKIGYSFGEREISQ